MDSLPFHNYNMEDVRTVFTAATETRPTTSIESFTPSTNAMNMSRASQFSPTAVPFQTRVRKDPLTVMYQQELRQADPAGFRADTVTPNASNIWNEGQTSSTGARNEEMMGIPSANNYVSMLTREQLYVLRSIHPSLLYEFLQEVAKVRSDKRLRRALPNRQECALCKKNGETEECYASHELKDRRGRVLCPVLRAFRCPRCGATGDRAHTLKYCKENVDGGLERPGSTPARRRLLATSLSLGRAAPPSPATSPAAPLGHSSLWSNF